MILSRRLLVFIAYVMWAGNAASAQQMDQLRGLKRLSLAIITGSDEGTQKCGVTRSLIREGIMYPASSARFQIAPEEEKAGPTFYVRALTLMQRIPQQCITSLEVMVYVPQAIRLDYQDETLPHEAVVLVWEDNALLVSIEERHPQKLQQAIEDIAKSFITDWTFANTERGP